MEKISIAYQLDNIWIPPTGRPYWTTHNEKGNAGPDLTDSELEEHGLRVIRKNNEKHD